MEFLIKSFDRSTLKYNDKDDFVDSGSFGEVFRAERTDTNDIVAVKVLSGPRRLKEEQERMFRKEVAILSGLAHPNIVKFLGVCFHASFYAFVMEFVENGNLDALLLEKLEVHLDWREWVCLARMAREVAVAMEYLHRQQPPIVHRDLKSANILVDANYHCKVSDFGLSKVRGISTFTTARQKKNFNPNGTLPFIPPERFDQSEVEEKARKGDVYSYGMILWQMKEKARPFGDNDVAIRAMVLSGARPAITESDDCPSQVTSLIKVCWAQKPDQRLDFRDIVVKLNDVVINTPDGRSSANFSDKCDSVRVVYSSPTVPCQPSGSTKNDNAGSSSTPSNLPSKEHERKIKFYWMELLADLETRVNPARAPIVQH
ncbi:probable serine/threonine-protein kinase DDB_G0271682 isoform X2 [Corticium candelabrum]|uniref:probable serine/threonine-protein kinase DDB_G0271682 isoform X2 n=1 Tax=Corticium candelabrum TaxID=121492 RepID=UPI002E275CDE|nr:probable serine/threonine-protein kinase DDB_G0271682 isoform X2 [Corticium candelabrum]